MARVGELHSVVREFPSSEKEKLSPVENVRLEMSGLVRSLAAPASPGESVKACIRRVASRSGLRFSQIKCLWYAEWKIIPAYVADKLRQAVEAYDRQIERQIEELKAQQARFYALTHHSSDPEFYSIKAAEGEPSTNEFGPED